ncbi:hypothetical protein [Clostridium sp. MD294]|uniref:hypothetical protein n=1 Tax=Clostridium sp. MD294 TaxID=97138 RepID=UPI00039EC158|nr:hypothetical protein [Clostridium sp. MD294]NDO45746.1 hypothetical protein [Clostridium sp. MD294]
MRKKYDDETLEKVFYYYNLAENRMLTAAQAADCLNLSESSLFRVIADFRENISKQKEEEIIQKYQKVNIHDVLNVKENPKNYSSEKSILEDIAITLAEILASVNELKQYIIEKDNTETYQENSFLKEATDKIEEPAWEELEELGELIAQKENENEELEIISEIEQHKTIWNEKTEPTIEDLEKELEKLEGENENITTLKNAAVELSQEHTTEKAFNIKPEEKQLDRTAIMCITQLNHMCKEINDLVPRENMEKMWNDWERICRGYGGRINSIYQRNWNQIIKKAKETKITENVIQVICDAQVKQMELELKEVSSQEAIKNISYTYYNWIRQVFEMCYLVQEPITQQRTKILYANYLTILKNIASYKIEQMQQK